MSRYWIDACAPFQTPQGDDFWPVYEGEFDTPDERKVADFYEEEAARQFVSMGGDT